MPANSNLHLHISNKEWVDSLLKNPCQCKGDFYPTSRSQISTYKNQNDTTSKCSGYGRRNAGEGDWRVGEVKSEHSSVSRSYVRKSTAFVSGCRGSGKQMCNRRGRTMAVPFFICYR